MDSHAVGSALLAAGQDLGLVAQKAASDERFDKQLGYQKQVTSANHAWETHLEQIRATNRQTLEGQREKAAQKRFDTQMDYTKTQAKTANKQRDRQIDIAQQNANTRADNQKSLEHTRKASSEVGHLVQAMNGIGTQITRTKQLRVKEEKQLEAQTANIYDPHKKAKAIEKIQAKLDDKYDPVLKSLVKQYEAYNNKIISTTGVSYSENHLNAPDPVMESTGLDPSTQQHPVIRKDTQGNKWQYDPTSKQWQKVAPDNG